MNAVLLAMDIILAVVLTVLVLLQRSEGGALGALGGGGGNSMFTGRQAGNMLTRLTWWCFALFVAVNLALVVLAKRATVAESISLVPVASVTAEDVIAEDENSSAPAEAVESESVVEEVAEDAPADAESASEQGED